ncbi:GDP-D-mannose dehydratase [Paramecium bursaria Chlorella virus MA1D]|nr:GDP-D-mannose dehydratase [Paramecium bursaria Chlorella virus MA1D]
MTSKVVLVTGATGQDGSYLCPFLVNKGYTVYGLVRHTSSENPRVEELKKQGINIVHGDLTDSSSLIHIITKIRPDEIYNLAAQSFVHDSFNQAEVTANVDALGVLRLLDAVRISGVNSRICQASSSELYGKVQEIPQTENTPFYPRSPYGVAKLYAYWICKNYRESYNMYVCNSICFNHESPNRGHQFVTRKITKVVANIFNGVEKCMYLGNIDAKRDWGYAKDYVEAMWLMLQQDTPDDYVIATGKTTSVREFVKMAFGVLDIVVEFSGEHENEVATVVSAPENSHVNVGDVVMRINKDFYRPAEVDLLVGDASKAQKILGWKPKTSLEELVRMMVIEDMKR